MALFAVGALFASGAWAQSNRPVVLTQGVTGMYTVAAELLGSADGTVVQLGSAGGSAAPRPAVRLTLTNGNTYDATADTNTPIVASVVPDNTAELTFTLSGAVFAQNVGGSTLDLRQPVATGDGVVNALSAEVISGGATGDGSVTFLIEVTGDTGIATGQRISFWVPDLRVTPTTIGSTDTTPPAPVTGVGIVASLVEKRAVRGTADGAVPLPVVVGARDSLTPKMNNVANRQVLATANVIGISMGESVLNVAEVALNNRMVFATSNETYTPRGATAATRALGVGTLDVKINSMTAAGATIYTLDPSDMAVEGTGTDADLDNALAGNVDVVVTGAFKTGDKVLYGDMRTEAKMSGGMAAVSIPITGMDSSTPFLYVPGGVDPLRPGRINAVAMRNFSRAGNAAGKPAMSYGTISYAGVATHAFAHGVVRGSGMDSSYLRVRCASATACTVFLDCHDQTGMNYFEEAGMIDAGATAVWSSDDVAEALGGGWSSGRGACDLMSNGDLEAQHMVRSHDTLVNNSAVVGRSLSLNEKQLTDIKSVVDDICMSVDGHGARAEVDADDDGDLAEAGDSAAIAATMCNNIIGRGRDLSAIDTTPGTDGL